MYASNNTMHNSHPTNDGVQHSLFESVAIARVLHVLSIPSLPGLVPVLLNSVVEPFIEL
jgi:hypothetical protein